MIEVKLEDFDRYRPELQDYAVNLLKNRRYNVLYAEIVDVAKDIVQNTYLIFHKKFGTAFVSEWHLSNFLKICLYNSYRAYFDTNRRFAQYQNNKLDEDVFGELSDNAPLCYATMDKVFSIEEVFEDFRRYLTAKQNSICDFLIEGKTAAEIARERQVSRQNISEAIKSIREKYNLYETKDN